MYIVQMSLIYHVTVSLTSSGKAKCQGFASSKTTSSLKAASTYGVSRRRSSVLNSTLEMESDSLLHQQLPSAYRSLQPQDQQAINHGPHLSHAHNHVHGHSHGHQHHTLASQSALDLSGIDENDPMFHQDLRIQDPNGHGFNTHPFNRNHGLPSMQQQVQVPQNGSPHTPHQHNGGGGQFGILTTGPIQHSSIGRLQQEDNLYGGAPDGGGPPKGKGHLATKIVPDPPNLQEWRQKLFSVDEVITLSQEECVLISGYCPYFC